MRFHLKLRVSPVFPVLMLLVCSAAVRAETRVVRQGENLQAALNAAKPGDVLMLEAGAEFSGNFVLPVKSGDTPIVVRSAASDSLPKDGVRIKPDQAPLLARIRSPNAMSALRTAPGAHHWNLLYLEFAGNKGGFGDLIQLGDGSSAQNTLEKVPNHLLLSHVYVHGDPMLGQKRCIALNAADVTIRDSHISDCKGVGMDTQAIAGWNGPGPFVIENNYLEGAGENVMFGGADPSIKDLVPTDIRFRGNYVTRPLSWRDPIVGTPASVTVAAESGGSLPAGRYAYRVMARGPVGQGTVGRSTASPEAAVEAPAGSAVRITWEPVQGATEYRVYGRAPGAQDTYWTVTANSFVDTGSGGTSGAVPKSPGTVWTVKNLFELKNARTVLVEGNIFENHWPQAQAGYAIVLTPRNSNGRCTWCIVESVRFENNVVRHVAAGINLLGSDIPTRPTKQTRDIAFRNNLFYDMGKSFGGNGWFLLIGAAPRELVIDHNTISNSGTTLVYAYGGNKDSPAAIDGFRFTNNAAPHGKYGIGGAFYVAKDVMPKFFPGSTITGNYLPGGASSRFPPGNRTEGTFNSEFLDVAEGNFQLKPGSQLRGAASDGKDVGADIDKLRASVADVQIGRFQVSAEPSASRPKGSSRTPR
jgi:hypothetical protein